MSAYAPNVCYVPEAAAVAQQPVYHYQQPGPPPSHLLAAPQDDQRKRAFTDGGCFVAFVAFLAVMAFVAWYALAEGAPARLYRGVNFNGKICGYDRGVIDLPYLYFPLDPSTSRPNLLVQDGRCVRFCPSNEDVKVGRTIPVSRRHTDVDEDGSSALTVEYNVESPAYASEVVGNAFCLPKDEKLRADAASALRSTWRQVAFAIGSMSSAFPVIVSYVIVATVMAFTVTWLLRFIPSLVLWLSSIYLVCLLVGGGIGLIRHGTYGKLHEVAALVFPMSWDWSIIIGVCLIIAGAATALSLWAAGKALTNAVKALELAGDVMYDIPNVLLTVPTITTAVIYLWMFLWIGISLNVFSLGKYVSGIVSIPLGRNGGGAYLPLHRQFVFPAFSIFAILFWCLGSWWIMETINAFTQFVLAYTGVSWYFSPPLPGSNGRERDVGPTPSLFAMSFGLAYHVGSFALGGVIMGGTRLLRALFCWASHRHSGSNDPCRIFLLNLFGNAVAPIRALVDTFTATGWVEMALTSVPFIPAMHGTTRRTHAASMPPSTRLTGTVAMISWILCASVAFTAGLLCYLSLARAGPYTKHTSQLFVASPLFAAMVTTVFSGFITAQFTAMWDVTADALLYCFTVEASEATLEDGHVSKFHDPPQLRQLLLGVMQDADRAVEAEEVMWDNE
eukprot:Polyplicarium_translucidae@DN2325_c0_g1_i1.p1